MLACIFLDFQGGVAIDKYILCFSSFDEWLGQFV